MMLLLDVDSAWAENLGGFRNGADLAPLICVEHRLSAYWSLEVKSL